MTLKGKDANDHLAQISARNAEHRADALARAKADAAARGKEPFDLAKLETLADTTSAGRLDSDEVRLARFEEKYYVEYPDIMTIEEFAAKVEELNRWA